MEGKEKREIRRLSGRDRERARVFNMTCLWNISVKIVASVSLALDYFIVTVFFSNQLYVTIFTLMVV